MNKTTLIIMLGAGIGFSASCVETIRTLDPDHCNSNAGDDFCGREYADGSRPFCRLGTPECNEAGGITDVEHDGCVAELPESACYSACGEGRSIDDDPECDPTAADGSGGTDTGDTGTLDDTTDGEDTVSVGDDDDDDDDTDGVTSTGTTEGGGCVDNDDCTDGAAPFCNDAGSCVACDEVPDGNAACAEADAGRPVCSEGACVECTAEEAGACDGQTPVCGSGNTCEACTAHFECPDSACHLDGPDVGACFGEGDVQMIANTGQLNSALGGLGAGDQAVLVLAGGTYSTSVDVGSSTEVAILGGGGVTITGDGGLNAVELIGSSITYFEGVEVANISGNGTACSGTSVWFDDSEVRNNAQVGLDISGGCAAHLRRSVVRANSGGGVVVNGASLEARNSAISNNLGSSPGMQLFNGSIEVSYSTLVGNFASGGTPDTLQCTAPSGFVRNSIVSGESASSISGCAALDWDYNAVDTTGLGATNDDSIGAWDSGWFAAPDTGDYHLTASGETEFMDIAQWQDGDPLTDVDGDAVPTDVPSFPGYDQP